MEQRFQVSADPTIPQPSAGTTTSYAPFVDLVQKKIMGGAWFANQKSFGRIVEVEPFPATEGQHCLPLERARSSKHAFECGFLESFGVEVVLLFRQSEKDISKPEAGGMNGFGGSACGRGRYVPRRR
jgi:hypothetical protein